LLIRNDELDSLFASHMDTFYLEKGATKAVGNIEQSDWYALIFSTSQDFTTQFSRFSSRVYSRNTFLQDSFIHLSHLVHTSMFQILGFHTFSQLPEIFMFHFQRYLLSNWMFHASIYSSWFSSISCISHFLAEIFLGSHTFHASNTFRFPEIFASHFQLHISRRVIHKIHRFLGSQTFQVSTLFTFRAELFTNLTFTHLSELFMFISEIFTLSYFPTLSSRFIHFSVSGFIQFSGYIHF
jgi:hypothetical protein